MADPESIAAEARSIYWLARNNLVECVCCHGEFEWWEGESRYLLNSEYSPGGWFCDECWERIAAERSIDDDQPDD